MKILPFGKRKGQVEDSSYSPTVPDAKNDKEIMPNQPANNATMNFQNNSTKIDEVQNAIIRSVGEPSLDNLMVILAAIGMSGIKLSVSEDGSSLSVSGIIRFSDKEEKITKKD